MKGGDLLPTVCILLIAAGAISCRVEFENKSIVTPFVSGSFDINLWHLSGDNSLACGWYWAPLLVPTRILPPAIVALPYVCEPSRAVQRMLRPVATSHDEGISFSAVLTILRCGSPPHIGQSSALAVGSDSGNGRISKATGKRLRFIPSLVTGGRRLGSVVGGRRRPGGQRKTWMLS